jgi:hypothetical protein
MISLRSLLATVVIFVAWSVMDFVIHQFILSSAYAATADMWRPMAEMKLALMHAVVFFKTFVFVYIFSRFFADKGIGAGFVYGILFGLATGFSMGYGTFAVQPLPHDIALTWFIGTTAEGGVAGLLVGAIVIQTPGDAVIAASVDEETV